mmetsp:Transcript_171148/g.548573  ORF Transcript_171148/g.548573 Transcript_171148/m.548573 type:complete len:285 (-) Transcript_171148:655-1509(-)
MAFVEVEGAQRLLAAYHAALATSSIDLPSKVEEAPKRMAERHSAPTTTSAAVNHQLDEGGLRAVVIHGHTQGSAVDVECLRPRVELQQCCTFQLRAAGPCNRRLHLRRSRTGCLGHSCRAGQGAAQGSHLPGALRDDVLRRAFVLRSFVLRRRTDGEAFFAKLAFAATDRGALPISASDFATAALARSRRRASLAEPRALQHLCPLFVVAPLVAVFRPRPMPQGLPLQVRLLHADPCIDPAPPAPPAKPLALVDDEAPSAIRRLLAATVARYINGKRGRNGLLC